MPNPLLLRCFFPGGDQDKEKDSNDRKQGNKITQKRKNSNVSDYLHAFFLKSSKEHKNENFSLYICKAKYSSHFILRLDTKRRGLPISLLDWILFTSR